MVNEMDERNREWGQGVLLGGKGRGGGTEGCQLERIQEHLQGLAGD